MAKYTLYTILFFLFFSSASFCKDKEIEIPKKQKFSHDEKDIYRIESKFSKIIVRDYGSIRSLYFVRDNGDEALESSIDLSFPQNLFLLYTQTLFSSFLLIPDRKDVLLIGLGGGGMVHYLNFYFPKINLDVVEIDSEIISIAKKYFFLKENPKTKIINSDAYTYIFESSKTYDIIFLDAFLKPSPETDSTGVSNKFKEKEFLKKLKERLKRNGLVAFNINTHEKMEEDILSIQEEFPNIYKFRKNRSGNLILLASSNPKKFTKEELLKVGKSLDSLASSSFSFEEIATYYLSE